MPLIPNPTVDEAGAFARGSFRGITNGLALIAVGVYGITAVYRGNLPRLIDLLAGEGQFLVWLLAALILLLIYEIPAVRPIAGPLIVVAVVGMALTAANNPTAVEGLRKLNNLFKGA